MIMCQTSRITRPKKINLSAAIHCLRMENKCEELQRIHLSDYGVRFHEIENNRLIEFLLKTEHDMDN